MFDDGYSKIQNSIKSKIAQAGEQWIPITEKQWETLYDEAINPGNDRDLKESRHEGVPDYLEPVAECKPNYHDWYRRVKVKRVKVTYDLYFDLDDILLRLGDNLWEGQPTLGMYNSILALKKRLLKACNMLY